MVENGREGKADMESLGRVNDKELRKGFEVGEIQKLVDEQKQGYDRTKKIKEGGKQIKVFG